MVAVRAGATAAIRAARLCSAYVAGRLEPATLAAAVKPPGVPFATSAGDVATPSAPVSVLACVPPPTNAAPAPAVPGLRENVTATPSSGCPVASSTRAERGCGNRPPTVTSCEGLVARIVVAAAWLFSANVATDGTPAI